MFPSTLLLALIAVSPQEGPNLVVNPSFEVPVTGRPLPEGWSGSSQAYSRDSSVARSGKASLRFSNQDPQAYRLCTQKVALRPGGKYRLSAWVKTQTIQGPESGATICLEWQGRDGKWLGGVYPSGVHGTRDWTRVEAATRLPVDAQSFTLACYGRQRITGTAWFDDVELQAVVDPPMQSIVQSPAYRNWITAEGPREVRVQVCVDLADYPELSPEALSLEARLQSQATGPVGWQGKADLQAQAGTPPARLYRATFRFPAVDLAPGAHLLSVVLKGPQGKVIQTETHRLIRQPDGFRPRALIDNHLRLLVDGKPFFPLGMYWSRIDEADLKLYSQSKFNCLMPYGSPNRQQMDMAEKYGLKVIYSVKDFYAGSAGCPPSIKTEADEERFIRQRVQQYRDHPALLAWYLNDELPQTFMPRLEAHLRWVAEEDPGHPAWVVLYQYREVANYLKTFDVIGTDPYPIGRSPASMAAQWTRETFRQVAQSRPMWQVPQAHHWGNYARDEAEKKKGHTPTYDEKRSMAWQCICEGATGLVFYSWYDVKRNPDVPFETQWTDLKRIAAEIDRAAPALLSLDPALPVQVPGEPSWLHWLARAYQDKLYLFAVNDGDGEGPVAFDVGGPIQSLRELTENRTLKPGGRSRFHDELPRLGLRIYEIVLKAE